MTKTYLGDGVFVDVERGMIKLTTEGGIERQNTIYLETAVVEALLAYLRQFYGAAAIDGLMH
jgi:Holliday junction resolvase